MDTKVTAKNVKYLLKSKVFVVVPKGSTITFFKSSITVSEAFITDTERWENTKVQNLLIRKGSIILSYDEE